MHDPRRVIDDLRSNLSTHNRQLAFLFGAGTSSAINIAPEPKPGEQRRHEPLIPGVDGLTTICATAVAAIGEDHTKAWGCLAQQCTQDNHAVNIENILSRVRAKRAAIGDGETLVGLNAASLKSLEDTICSSIAKCVLPEEAKIPKSTPHDGFVKWVQRVHRTAALELFTTNYDILVERAFEQASVPVFDGFVGAHEPFFYAGCVDDDELLPRPQWVRVWKLHGSVNWRATQINGRTRIVRGAPAESGEMILPSHRKYDESRKQPYTSFMDRLARILRREHALLITNGYGFGDDHINDVVYRGLELNPTANVIALWFESLNETDTLVKEAEARSNLTVIGPNGGVLATTFAEWQLTQPVDKKTHAFLDTAFDSNAQLDDAGSPAAMTNDLKGRMRLGDFNWFCRFLSEMDGARQ